MQYDIFTDFHVNRFCNFRCSYCYLHGADKRSAAHRGAPKERIVDGFNRTGLTWFVHMTGGEPFLHPEFPALCEELARRHYLSVNTNLSTGNVREFAERVPREKVGYVHCSYHNEFRKSAQAKRYFIEQANYLKSKGYPVHASQVIHPGIVEEYPRLFEELRREGVILRPKVLKGLYRYRSYPSAYTTAERDMIYAYIERCREEEKERDFFTAFFFREDEFAEGDLSFRGKPCAASAKFVVIHENGDVVRCMDTNEPLGNLFDGTIRLRETAVPCPSLKCSSVRFGLNFAEGPPVPLHRHPARAVVGQVIRNARRWLKRQRERLAAGPRRC